MSDAARETPPIPDECWGVLNKSTRRWVTITCGGCGPYPLRPMSKDDAEETAGFEPDRLEAVLIGVSPSAVASDRRDLAEQIVAEIEVEAEAMRRRVEPPPGGGAYLREDDDVGRLDAYENAARIVREIGNLPPEPPNADR